MKKQEKNIKAGRAYADFVMSYLDEAAQAAVNEAGLELLRRFGFNTDGFLESEKAQAFLAAEMLKKRCSLVHYAIPNEKERKNIIYFELIKNGRIVGKSRTVEVAYRGREEGADEDGEGSEAGAEGASEADSLD